MQRIGATDANVSNVDDVNPRAVSNAATTTAATTTTTTFSTATFGLSALCLPAVGAALRSWTSDELVALRNVLHQVYFVQRQPTSSLYTRNSDANADDDAEVKQGKILLRYVGEALAARCQQHQQQQSGNDKPDSDEWCQAWGGVRFFATALSAAVAVSPRPRQRRRLRSIHSRRCVSIFFVI